MSVLPMPVEIALIKAVFWLVSYNSSDRPLQLKAKPSATHCCQHLSLQRLRFNIMSAKKLSDSAIRINVPVAESSLPFTQRLFS